MAQIPRCFRRKQIENSHEQQQEERKHIPVGALLRGFLFQHLDQHRAVGRIFARIMIVTPAAVAYGAIFLPPAGRAVRIFNGDAGSAVADLVGIGKIVILNGLVDGIDNIDSAVIFHLIHRLFLTAGRQKQQAQTQNKNQKQFFHGTSPS